MTTRSKHGMISGKVLIFLFLVTGMRGALAVDFDASMRKHEHQAVLDRGGSTAGWMYDFFKGLYEKNSPEKIADSQQLKIPRIMHHVWLGGKLPAEYEPYWHSWLAQHPDWTFIFWSDNPSNFDKGVVVVRSFDELEHYITDANSNAQYVVVDVRQLKFDNRDIYDAAINYGEKSDILKWEIVYRFGGVYIDTDFECLKRLDAFHYQYDCYTGLQPLDTNLVQLGAALYGACPGHPIMRSCVEGVRANAHIMQIVHKTGPLHFTRCFIMNACKQGMIDVALPASYLYPCGYEQRGQQRQYWQQPESYAVHHWAGSWLKPEGFVK